MLLKIFLLFFLNKKEIESSTDEKPKILSELDEDLENDLCNLWDISANIDVCKVLNELNSIEIFEQYIKRKHGVYPRAIEILIGVLGNMSLLDSVIRDKILINQSLVKLFVETLFFDLVDTQTLIQILRLFNTFFF